MTFSKVVFANNSALNVWQVATLPAFTGSKLTIETLEQGVKYV